jgi:hypothetical protein
MLGMQMKFDTACWLLRPIRPVESKADGGRSVQASQVARSGKSQTVMEDRIRPEADMPSSMSTML